jgi:glycerol uptake facilitator protein
MAFGTDAGYAINPARDLGPRLAEYITGYGHAWTDQYGNQYWWVPIVGPIIGGLVGGALYRYLIERYLPPAGTGDAPAEVGELPDEDTTINR